jgi:site-specific DNA-methyltransferase (adenine-specific)
LKIGPYGLDSIIAGDARELAAAIPDESVDLVLTDPPFGIGFKYEGYNDDTDAYPALISWIAETAQRIIKPGGLCFVFQAQPQLRLTWPLFPGDSRLFMAAKNFVQIRPTPVQYAYDPVVFWQKPGRLLPAYQGRDWHIASTSITSNRGMNEAGFHECPRPLDTCQYIVGNFSPVGGVVCDFFMGSGTTAVAAKTQGRHWLGFELRATIAELAQRRVEQAQSPLLASEPEQAFMFEAAGAGD